MLSCFVERGEVAVKNLMHKKVFLDEDKNISFLNSFVQDCRFVHHALQRANWLSPLIVFLIYSVLFIWDIDFHTVHVLLAVNSITVYFLCTFNFSSGPCPCAPFPITLIVHPYKEILLSRN